MGRKIFTLLRCLFFIFFFVCLFEPVSDVQFLALAFTESNANTEFLLRLRGCTYLSNSLLVAYCDKSQNQLTLACTVILDVFIV